MNHQNGFSELWSTIQLLGALRSVLQKKHIAEPGVSCIKLSNGLYRGRNESVKNYERITDVTGEYYTSFDLLEIITNPSHTSFITIELYEESYREFNSPQSVESQKL